jgi:hypothetical protein
MKKKIVGNEVHITGNGMQRIICYSNFKTDSRIRISLKRGVLDTTLCDKVVSDLWQVCGFP